MVPLESYMGCDYILVYKLYYKDGLLMSKNDVEKLDWNVNLLRPLKEALFLGWLTKEEVKNLDVDDFGAGDCYWTYLSYEDANRENKTPLNPRYSFWEKLKPHKPFE